MLIHIIEIKDKSKKIKIESIIHFLYPEPEPSLLRLPKVVKASELDERSESTPEPETLSYSIIRCLFFGYFIEYFSFNSFLACGSSEKLHLISPFLSSYSAPDLFAIISFCR